MDQYSRVFKILNNSTNITVPIEPVELIVYTDSDAESTTSLDFQPFVDSPEPRPGCNGYTGRPK